MIGRLVRHGVGRIDRMFGSNLASVVTPGDLPAPFRERQAIFVHIPKAAGSSVSQALFGCQVGHVPIADLYAVDYRSTRRFFKFTFVREPLDRLHSAFEFLQRGGMNENDRNFAEAHLAGLDFGQFVELLPQRPELIGWWHFRPQASFLCAPGNPDKVLVDFVGRFENLEEDFRRVCERMGIEPNLPRVNETAGRTGTAEISPAIAARVRDIYARDYRLFGYG